MPSNEAIVFNIQRYSIDDGPGVRTTVFLKGCPLRCLWCSNPESQEFAPQLTNRFTSCKRCGSCVAACPHGALSLGEDGIVIDRRKCELCGTCVGVCLYEAMQISGRRMSAQEAFAVVKRDAVYYKASGGGCTCSGGEILSQPGFVRELFSLCRDAGIHTCADTSGFGSPEALEAVMEYADLFYFDIKQPDPAKHRECTGTDNDVILRNLRTVYSRGIPVTVRVPLIPGYNDSAEDLEALARTVNELAPGSPVNLLPYHRYGASKYRMLGREYPLEGLAELTEEQKQRAAETVRGFGLECIISH